MLALHRVRARLLKQRIALSNQIRALLHERGVAARPGAAGLRAAVAAALAADPHVVVVPGRYGPGADLRGRALGHPARPRASGYDLTGAQTGKRACDWC